MLVACAIAVVSILGGTDEAVGDGRIAKALPGWDVRMVGLDPLVSRRFDEDCLLRVRRSRSVEGEDRDRLPDRIGLADEPKPKLGGQSRRTKTTTRYLHLSKTPTGGFALRTALARASDEACAKRTRRAALAAARVLVDAEGPRTVKTGV